VDFSETLQVSHILDEPLLSAGQAGEFDDSGTMATWLVNFKGVKYLYYIGWNLGVSVPFRNAIGVALSTDDGLTFQKYSRGPILDRSIHDPCFTASCCVMIDNGLWRMWYLSCLEWDANLRHRYHIKYAESHDGLDWQRDGTICIDFASNDEYAISRPSVIKDTTGYKMWYSYRGEYYKIGYAESDDGIVWRRYDTDAGLDKSPSGWDSDMVEYPFVFDEGGTRYMLYNGNGYGKTGVGYAVWQP
jgi:hypothetical protein